MENQSELDKAKQSLAEDNSNRFNELLKNSIPASLEGNDPSEYKSIFPITEDKMKKWADENADRFNLEVKMGKNINMNLVSDGYHTFSELYEHRITNFIALCKVLTRDEEVNYKRNDKYIVWRNAPSDGWFILGINREKGKQITYHLPESKYEQVKNIAILMTPLGDNFDGHTSADVLERLSRL